MARASGRALPGEPVDPNEPTYPDEMLPRPDASRKFTEVANKYSSTEPGSWRAITTRCVLKIWSSITRPSKNLKKISSGGDKELADMAQYQIAVIDSRTGKPMKPSKFTAPWRIKVPSSCRGRWFCSNSREFCAQNQASRSRRLFISRSRRNSRIRRFQKKPIAGLGALAAEVLKPV